MSNLGARTLLNLLGLFPCDLQGHIFHLQLIFSGCKAGAQISVFTMWHLKHLHIKVDFSENTLLNSG